MHQGSVLSPFLFAVVVDVATEFAREGELLYAVYNACNYYNFLSQIE